MPGARQIVVVVVAVELVPTSCGMAVPFFDYRAGRDEWRRAMAKRGPAPVQQHWHTRNTHSLDGNPTGI